MFILFFLGFSVERRFGAFLVGVLIVFVDFMDGRGVIDGLNVWIFWGCFFIWEERRFGRVGKGLRS